MNCMNMSPLCRGGRHRLDRLWIEHWRRKGRMRTLDRKNVSISDTLTRNQPLHRSARQNLLARPVDGLGGSLRQHIDSATDGVRRGQGANNG